MKRHSGILMPVFSLDSGYGIGDFGKTAYKFVDFLCNAGQKIWQILPLTKTGIGNSPYSSDYSASINPLFISPELLVKRKLLKSSEIAPLKTKTDRVDYGKVYTEKTRLLNLAFSRFDKKEKAFLKFISKKENFNYALFSAISEASNFAPFSEWESGLKNREKSAIKNFYKQNSERVLYYAFIQFIALEQWLSLKSYANSKGIKILGDAPIYVSYSSVDVWANPELFELDQNLNSCRVAGVPPDYFCEDGQLWGNPLYDYSAHARNSFAFWKKRIRNALTVYDLIRIDHFRAFDRFYAVDANETTAKYGVWELGPKEKIINAFSFAKNKIIAEDLGMIDDGVRELLKYSGYPGMKVLSFAYDGDVNNLHLPEHAVENSVTYTGTHDNDTLKGFVTKLSEHELLRLKNGLNRSAKILEVKVKLNSINGIINAFIALAQKSKSKLCIIPVQDYFKMGQEFRINRPGEVSFLNWSTIIDKRKFTQKQAENVKRFTALGKR